MPKIQEMGSRDGLACPGLTLDQDMPKIPKMPSGVGLAGLTLDQDMPKVLWKGLANVALAPNLYVVAAVYFSKTGHADIISPPISACPGLRLDQDMQNSENAWTRPDAPRWWAQSYPRRLVQAFPEFCMSRSEVRPGHADISGRLISACPIFDGCGGTGVCGDGRGNQQQT